MSYDTLILERTGHVAVLTLNRPERMNAFDSAMRAELPLAWQEISDDPEIRVVVLTGAGERAFCAGMDLREVAAREAPRDASGAAPRVQITSMDCNVGKPVICAVNGVCAGGGLAFVADSDICICSENASFTDARTRAGQISIHGTLRLARRIPIEALLRLVLLASAERLTAARAYDIGLVSQVVAPDRLRDTAIELALAVARNSPSAVHYTRQAIWESLNHGLDRALELGWDAITGYSRSHPDVQEGARAFVEKREPHWAPPPKPGSKPGDDS
ncbi:MAG: enoyl-CoA hydratase/isomerase family protein [Deltaproteobacteria bacterium]|nr:MAG: enoyl-CoA hydratase/isomerase family protein [Deltaproteobacteria bacterium]